MIGFLMMVAIIAEKGTVEELRRALPPEGAQRTAAIRQRHEEKGSSLLDNACGYGRLDMAAALVREFGFPVNDRDPKFGITALILTLLGQRIRTLRFVECFRGDGGHVGVFSRCFE